VNVKLVDTEWFIWQDVYGMYRGFEKMSEEKSVDQDLDEVAVAVRRIHRDVCEGDIVVVAWRVKRLAVFLDRKGYGCPLQKMLSEESVS